MPIRRTQKRNSPKLGISADISIFSRPLSSNRFHFPIQLSTGYISGQFQVPTIFHSWDIKGQSWHKAQKNVSEKCPLRWYPKKNPNFYNFNLTSFFLICLKSLSGKLFKITVFGLSTKIWGPGNEPTMRKLEAYLKRVSAKTNVCYLLKMKETILKMTLYQLREGKVKRISLHWVMTS